MKTRKAQIARHLFPAIGLMAACWASGGCGARDGSPEATEPHSIEVVSGDDQAGLPGRALPSPLVVRVLGPTQLDLLGRPVPAPPASGAAVIFEIEDPRTRKAPVSETEGAVPPGGESAPAPAAAPPAGPAAERIPSYPHLFETDPSRGPDGRRDDRIHGDGKRRIEVTTDARGLARAWVRLGSSNRKWNVEAKIARRDKEKVRFSTVTGVEVESDSLEGVVGGTVPIRLWLKGFPKDLTSAGPDDGLEPIEGRQIVFRLAASPESELSQAALRDKRNVTDEEGFRGTELRLGARPGLYTVLAEIDPSRTGADEDVETIPAIVFNVHAFDWVQNGLVFVAGLLLFVVGVRLLGSGFLLLTSAFMHLPTGSWAGHRVRGYLGGALAGAIFESATLVVLYLISFCNGGVLTASRAFGMLLGATVGGTLLPQILAQDVGLLAVPVLLVGLACFIARRQPRLVAWGWAFLGAGLILVSWSLLDHSASVAATSGQFRAAMGSLQVDPSASFQTFVPRFLSYFAAATAASFLLRTSNLVVVVAMALAAHRLVGLDTAVPIVVGANLGASLMVAALTLPKRREARRAALTHVIVQVTGCLAFLVLSLPVVWNRSPLVLAVDWLTPGRVLDPSSPDVAQHVASVHTLFNLATGLFFLAFPGWLLRQVDRLAPSLPTGDEIKPYHLDRNLVTVPALALRQATEESVYLTEVCRRTVAEAFDSFRYNDLDLSEQVVRREEVIATIHRDLSEYLVDVSSNPLARRDASQIEVLQTAASCLSRIGGLGERLREVSSRKIDEQITGLEEVDREINEVYDLVMTQFENVVTLLRERDPKTEENTVKTIERLAKLSSRVAAQWRQRIEQAGAQANALALHLQTTIYQEAFDLLFRIASHLAHIAERMRILRP